MMRSITIYITLIILLTGPVFAQKNQKRYEANLVFASGFRDRGILEEVRADGIILNDGRGPRLVEAGSIVKISIRPYRSRNKAFIAGTIAGAAGAVLTYGIKEGHGQAMSKGKLPGLVLSGGVLTGGYFWLMNSVIRTVVFRNVNQPGRFNHYKPHLEKLSVAEEDKL